MTDTLDRLAARYHATAPGRPLCPKCGKRETEARIVVQVRRIVPSVNGKQKTGASLVNRVRSVCGECAAEITAELIERLPKEAR